MRILVIEDEHKIAQALKKALQQENYSVDLSFDGDDGHNMVMTEPYDLAIIDLMLPGKYNGIEIIKEMRKNRIHTPVLILTAKCSLFNKTNGLNSGADDYLTKPFALEELLARVRALLRRPIEVQQTVLTAEDLTLNTVTCIVKRANKEINLTGKEFALLEYLLRNQGRPCSKEMIINHIWDYDANILPNTVEVYVKYLRQKVDEPFSIQLIKTIRGFGYKIDTSEK